MVRFERFVGKVFCSNTVPLQSYIMLDGAFGIEMGFASEGEHDKTRIVMEPPSVPPSAGPTFVADAYALSTGRACLSALLAALRPTCVYVPFYTCNTVYQPFVERGVAIRFYAIDERFLPENPPLLREGEYILWTNYFGVCSRAVSSLAARYGARLLIDDTHAFFVGRHEGLWSFSSARKFFAVPDGAYLYAPSPIRVSAPRFDGISLRHLVLRAEGRRREALCAEAAYERTLGAAVLRISRHSEEALTTCNFDREAEKRRKNFAYLHAQLGATNRIALDLSAADAAFRYPYLPATPPDRMALRRRGIFIQPLWSDVLIRAAEGYAWERHLARTLLALPIDQDRRADLAALCDALATATG